MIATKRPIPNAPIKVRTHCMLDPARNQFLESEDMLHQAIERKEAAKFILEEIRTMIPQISKDEMGYYAVKLPDRMAFMHDCMKESQDNLNEVIYQLPNGSREATEYLKKAEKNWNDARDIYRLAEFYYHTIYKELHAAMRQ